MVTRGVLEQFLIKEIKDDESWSVSLPVCYEKTFWFLIGKRAAYERIIWSFIFWNKNIFVEGVSTIILSHGINFERCD